ncbi:hypothetical protein SAMN04488490_1683 [Marinobacter sp. LV10R510-11A]|uniref:hypothetical protein n=1 Tax=Marinobacter sp. LV10R510-11A TaxID=1415568 RepID=UPI000BB823B6|nr:hypothetical protein [Marinobacter sp. LV10R510-11A]SOB76017.1 hypothetical protein SAMN04488490_1683 [Marinobacter sp. LV10R510-11A]
MNLIKLLPLSILSLALIACGGGGGSDNSSNDDSSEPIILNEGGPVSDPTPIDFQNLNEIKTEAFYNHFGVSVGAGDILIISGNIDTVINDTDNRRCLEQDGYYTGIRILNLSGVNESIKRSCTPYFFHQFIDAGNYDLKLGFPSAKGSFVATILPADSEPQLGNQLGTGGHPENLGRIDIDGKNKLTSHPATNHFGYKGKAGETIYLQAYVDPREDATTERRCSEFGDYFSNKYAFGWAVMSEDISGSIYHRQPVFSCSGSLEHTFPKDGIYHFNFRSFLGGTGYFYATTTPAPL